MIRQIQEINFPEYATLHQATITLSAMGERTITTQIRIDGDIVPEFGITENGTFKPMELSFKGERFVLPIREPQAMKDNTTRNSLIDLTFYSWPIYQLKRYFFVEMASTTSGTAIADKYVASLALNLENFVNAFNLVLDYYFNGKIQLDLFGAGRGYYGVEPVYFEINYSYLWDVLSKMYELYNEKWWIEYNSSTDTYLIKIGYSTDTIDDHIFSYGYEGGLLKFERQVQDDDISNILLGRGGEKNLPYRYFKRTDEYNTEWTADPDAIPELQNIYFDRLRDYNFRWYVRGWMTNPNHDPSWERSGYRYPTYTENDCPDQYLFAYRRGKTDEKFNPVEYVKDDVSIAKYGERWGALDNNDNIYPTIQGVSIPPYGRIDEAVDISTIVTDDISEYAANAAIETSIRDMRISLQGRNDPSYTLESDAFTIPEGSVGNITYRPMSEDTANPQLVEFDTSRSYVQAVLISSGSSEIIPTTYDSETGMFAIVGLPSGTYRLKLNMSLRITRPATSATGTFGIENIVLSTSAVDTNAWKPTFDIWVKNIWQTTKGVNESPSDYSTRVWTPILGDRVGNEAKIVFSTGAMSISQDYEFVIASYPEYDQSKTINGVPSEWKITVYKSDAEFQATGLYIPNARSTQPVAGDKFFFTGIDMPFIYVEWAEKNLNAYKTTELEKVRDLNPSWIVTLDKVRAHTLEDSDYEHTLAERLNAGITIHTTDPRFTKGTVLELYVQTITYTWNEPSDKSPYLVPDIEIVLSDKIVSSEGPVSQLQSQVDAISQAYVQTSDVEATVRKIAGSLYLKKTGERDTSASPTAFSSKVTSTNFRKGGIGGRGWGIYQDNTQSFAASEAAQTPTRRLLSAASPTRAVTATPQVDTKSVMEVDKLIVRDEMQVNSLVVNQISYRGGKEVISAANIEVTQVIENNDSYVCFFDQKQNSVANLFEINDIAYGQIWTAENNELRYYKMLVIDKDVNSITLSKTVKDGWGAPKVGDVIVQYGNISDISRQYVIVRDVIGGGYERMLSGLNSVMATGEEYYFAGTQVSENTEFVPLYEGADLALHEGNDQQLGYMRLKHSPRWFVGEAEGQYAEWKDGVLNINGTLAVTTQMAKSDGTYYSLSSYLDGIYTQLGGNFTVWYEEGTPTLENYPANTWDTVEVLNSHVDDLYFDELTGNCYIFTLTPGQEGNPDVYSWEQITRAEFEELIANDLRASVDGLKYLREATNRGTLVQGGLVLTSLIQLGKTENDQFNVWAGINGLRDDEEPGGGIAAWYGGPMVDHENDTSALSYAQSLFRMDGSGYLAGGMLNWGIDNGQAYLTLNGESVIGGLGNVSLNDIANLMFEVVQYSSGHYAVHLKDRAYYNGSQVSIDGLYATGFVSAGGTGEPGGGGGGGASYLDELSDVSISASLSPGQGLVWNGSVWTNGTVTPDLSGYVPTSRTINGHALTTNISITKADLSLSNVEDTALSTWAGTTNITTLGTIATGVWQGTPIANDYLASSSMTLWGQTATLGGSVSGDLSTVGKIAFDVQNTIASSGNVLEVVNIGTEQNPIYALHSTLPLYSDSWISASGVGGSGSSIAMSLGDLEDVDLTDIGNGKVLSYDATSQLWKPIMISATGGGPEKLFFGTSSTAAGTAVKVVTCPEFTSADLVEGTTIHVLMTAANEMDSGRKLNINGTGAVDIYYSSQKKWYAYEVVTFVYYSGGWRMAPTVSSCSGGGSGYTLPAASTSALGGVMVNSVNSSTLATIISTRESSGGASGQYRNYPVNLSSDNKLYVNVPWYAGSGGGGGSSVAWGTAFDNNPVNLTIDGTTKRVCLNGYAAGGGGGGNYLPLAGGTMTGTITAQNIVPSSSVYTLGTSTSPWSRLYFGDEVYLYYDSANGCIRVSNAGFAADGFVSAGGISSGWGSIGLGDLMDVDTETMPLRTGQLLGYNASTGNWEPIVSMSANLQGGEVLVYNATSKKWVPTNPSNL